MISLVPSGSKWRRTKGNHSGRLIEVVGHSNRAIKIKLIGRDYAKSKPNDSGAQDNLASVPFDEFTAFYTPETPQIRNPDRRDLHKWHIASNRSCNCPPYVLAAFPPARPTVHDIIETKYQRKPYLTVTSTPEKREEVLKELLIVNEPAISTPTTRKHSTYTNAPLDKLISTDKQREFTEKYTAIWESETPPQTNWYLKLCQEYGINAKTASRIIEAHNANIPAKVKTLRNYNWDRARQLQTPKKLTPVPPTLQDTINPVVAPEDVPTLIEPPTYNIPPYSLTTTNVNTSYTIYVVRETTITIEAPTLLDALAIADADPTNVEVIGVMKVR